MPKIVGAMRVRDDELFLHRCMSELVEYIDEFVVVDNWCVDNSINIIRNVFDRAGVPVTIWKTPDHHFHEARDKNRLLEMAHEANAEWIFNIDSDEVYEQTFVENIKHLCSQPTTHAWSIGATHMWSRSERADWWNVTDFRVDMGWANIEYPDGAWAQHEKPTLFRAIPGQLLSMAKRYDGVMCTRELFNKKQSTGYVFAHWGYATPMLREKKCNRHGSVPTMTDQELRTWDIHPPGWEPEGFSKEVCIQTYRDAWVDNNETLDIRPLHRRIWKNNG